MISLNHLHKKILVWEPRGLYPHLALPLLLPNWLTLGNGFQPHTPPPLCITTLFLTSHVQPQFYCIICK